MLYAVASANNISLKKKDLYECDLFETLSTGGQEDLRLLHTYTCMGDRLDMQERGFRLSPRNTKLQI